MVAAIPEDLAGCPVAFTDAASAQAELDAVVDGVLACALTPFGTRLPTVAPMVLDAAVPVPTDGDRFGGRNGVGRVRPRQTRTARPAA